MIDFTSEQNLAIETNDKHLRIIACAGSGKTSTVAGKVAYLLNPLNGLNVLPKNIIAFTYTKKAAAELKNRILKFIKEVPGLQNMNGLADMYVGTIHGWCLKALQENEYDYRTYSVLDDIKLQLFVDKNYEAIGMKDIAKIGNDSVSMKIFTDTRKFIQLMNIVRESNLEKPLPKSIDAALKKYISTLDKNRYFDFTMIMLKAVECFDKKGELYSNIKENLKYLIVDEYQDINPIQDRLITKLHETSKAIVTVVGDDDQNIYNWRGSNNKFIKDFPKKFTPSTDVKLEMNYRSSKGITTLAETVISRNDRIKKKMYSAENQIFVKNEDVLYNYFDSIPDENEFIAYTIAKLRGTAFQEEEVERGLDYSDFAILLRSWSKAKSIVETLEKHEIPYITAGVNQLFDTPEVIAARAIFQFLDKSIEEAELKNIWLNIPRNKIDSKKLDTAIEKLRKQFPENKISKKTGKLDYDYNLQSYYWDFLRDAEITEEVFQPDMQAEIRMFNLGKFSQVVYDFEFINYCSSTPSFHLFNFLNFIRYAAVDYYPEGWLNNPYKTPSAVQIMTVHQAKGLEFPAVFIPGLNKNYLPAKTPGGLTEWHFLDREIIEDHERYFSSKDDPQEERRLLYVALTRPQKYLFISRAPDLNNQLYRQESRFVQEILEAEDIVVSTIPSFNKKKKLIPQAKDQAINISLNFSILKDFFECPYRFKLVSMYGFNFPLSRRMGFGKSMHDSLMELHKRIMKGESVTDDTPLSIAQKQSHFPYMGTSEKLQVMKDLVRRKVSDYYQRNKDNLKTIEFVEQDILLNMDDGILVNGRIDLIKRKLYDNKYETTIIEFKSDDDPLKSKVTTEQLKLYALGHRELTGEKADYIQIYDIKSNKKGPQVYLEENHLEETQNKIRKTADEIRVQHFDRINIKGICMDCFQCRLCSSGIKFAKNNE
jgi:DNA helicase II / ATP-dependent DNA helicase PcrA